MSALNPTAGWRFQLFGTTTNELPFLSEETSFSPNEDESIGGTGFWADRQGVAQWTMLSGSARLDDATFGVTIVDSARGVFTYGQTFAIPEPSMYALAGVALTTCLLIVES